MKRNIRIHLVAMALLLSTDLALAGGGIVQVEVHPQQPAGGKKLVNVLQPAPKSGQQKIKSFGNHYFTPMASKQQLNHAVNGHYFTIGGQSHPQFAAGPYYWPQGYGYMRYSIGDSFPQQFWLQQYFINDVADYGLQPPPPGYQWVRFGPDLMLVNLGSGAIAQVAYGAFAETQPSNGYNGQ